MLSPHFLSPSTTSNLCMHRIDYICQLTAFEQCFSFLCYFQRALPIDVKTWPLKIRWEIRNKLNLHRLMEMESFFFSLYLFMSEVHFFSLFFSPGHNRSMFNVEKKLQAKSWWSTQQQQHHQNSIQIVSKPLAFESLKWSNRLTLWTDDTNEMLGLFLLAWYIGVASVCFG